MYQLDQGFKRLLYVRKDRTEESLNGFFDLLDSIAIEGIGQVARELSQCKTKRTPKFCLRGKNLTLQTTRGPIPIFRFSVQAAWILARLIVGARRATAEHRKELDS